MKLKIAWLFGIISVIGLISPTFAEEITHTITFEASHLIFSTFRNYDQIYLPGCECSFQPGAPQLPVKSLQLELPAGAKVENVELIATDSDFLPGKFQLWPVQPPQPLSLKTEPVFNEPNPQIYHSALPYPVQLFEFTGQGTLGQAELASLLIFPVQYFPDTEQLKFNSRLTLRIHYQILPKSNRTGVDFLHKMRNQLTGQNVPATASDLEPDRFPYLIITSQELEPAFQPLVEWKTQKGVRAKIITTQWLIQNYRPYPSNRERIREFLREAVADWGTRWVLLGGDTNIILDRGCWVFDCEIGMDSNENFIPCDLYFADLDGTWDANENRIFGEVADEVDLYPDLFVGRAPCENSEEVRAFVTKLMTYEKSPDLNYILKILFAAELLWQDPYTDQGVFLDRLAEEIIPERFNVTRLYQSLGNENYTSVTHAMNRGVGLFNHDGHCWYNAMSLGSGALANPDMDALHNKNAYGILFSIGCWPAAYDFDCIAEHYLTNPQGGGVAFVGNSRYGWGSPGNPGLGYSDRFNETFFHDLFNKNIYHLGELVAQTKAHYVPLARQANVYRWCMYQLNLLGDPEMPIWTDTPRELTAIFPAEIPADSSRVSISVLDAGSPLPDVTVCLMNSLDVYQVGKTDLNGQVHFTVNSRYPNENITLTATAQNFLPLVHEIRLSTTAAYVAVAKIKINDSASAWVDSLANPGETVQLDLNFKNYGCTPAQNCTALLKSTDARLTVSENQLELGDLPAKASKFFPAAFSIRCDSSLQADEAINLLLSISQAETTWTHALGLQISAPIIHVVHIALTDSVSGNANGFAEAGEIVQAKLWLENTGSTTATNVKIRPESLDSTLRIPKYPRGLVVIQPDSCVSFYPFEIQIAENLPGAPAPYFPQIVIHTSAANFPPKTDTLTLVIGKTGLAEDMESGVPDWTQSGTGRWQLNHDRFHSGQTSWYCGNPATRTYDVLLNQSLESPRFYLAPNSQLTFWLWYDVALYSAWGYEGDGLQVEILNGSQWEQLDFIGTGGALNPVLLGNDWMPYTYALSKYKNGQEMQVRFRFVSDIQDEPFEGVYLDDVWVGAPEFNAPQSIYDPVIIPEETAGVPEDFQISQNFPNPFNPVTSIAYQLPEKTEVNLQIFNLLGQRVRELVHATQPAGKYQVQWDGKNDRGEIVGSGVYFYQITTQAGQLTRKMLLVK
jgi:hypothetical protein